MMKSLILAAALTSFDPLNTQIPDAVVVPDGQGVMEVLEHSYITPFLDASNLKGDYSVELLVNGASVDSTFSANSMVPIEYYDWAYKYGAESGNTNYSAIDAKHLVEFNIQDLGLEESGNHRVRINLPRISLRTRVAGYPIQLATYGVNVEQNTGSFAALSGFVRKRSAVEADFKIAQSVNFLPGFTQKLEPETDYDVYLIPLSNDFWMSATLEDTFLTKAIQKGYVEGELDADTLQSFQQFSHIFSVIQIDSGYAFWDRENGDKPYLIEQVDVSNNFVPKLKINHDYFLAGAEKKIQIKINNLVNNREWLSKEISVSPAASQCQSINFLPAKIFPEYIRYRNMSLDMGAYVTEENKEFFVPIAELNKTFSVMIPYAGDADFDYLGAGRSSGFRKVDGAVYLDFIKDNLSDADHRYLSYKETRSFQLAYKIKGCSSETIEVPVSEMEVANGIVPSIEWVDGPSEEPLTITQGVNKNLRVRVTDADRNLVAVRGVLKKAGVEGQAEYHPIPVSWYRFPSGEFNFNDFESVTIDRSNNLFGDSEYELDLPVFTHDPVTKFIMDLEGGGEGVPEVAPGFYDLLFVAYDSHGNADMVSQAIEVKKNSNLNNETPLVMLEGLNGAVPVDGYSEAAFSITPEQQTSYLVWTLDQFPGAPAGSAKVMPYVRLIMLDPSGNTLAQINMTLNCSSAEPMPLPPGNYLLRAAETRQLLDVPATSTGNQQFSIMMSNRYPQDQLDAYNLTPINYCYEEPPQ